jgi:hypothetical protein
MYNKDKLNKLTLESEYLIKKGKKLFDLDFDKETKNKNKNSKICKKRTEVLFTEFFQEINHIYDSIHNSKKEWYHYQLKKINTVAQIPKPRNFNSKGFPEDIRKHIEENAIYQIEYDFSLQGRNIKIYFIIEAQDIDKSVEYFSNYIEKIMLWLSLIDKYASKKCSRTLTIYIYLTSLLKTLPNSNIDIISENHANTAFTYTCLPVSEIVIFRKEEWFKVFLHETFHNFGLDFSGMNNDYCRQHMLSIFDVNSDVNLYESYTEFWAEIMNCLLASFYLLKDKKDVRGFLEMSFFFIECERKFSFFQMVKVLDFMGLRYHDLYSTTRQSQMKRDTFYKENTNVLAYYIIKTILMNQYSDFICWCDANHFSLLDFKKTMNHQREFCKYIEDQYKSQMMLKNVHYFEDVFSRMNAKNRFLKNNMRMTMIEMA